QAHQRFDSLNYSQMVQLPASLAAQWFTFRRGWGLYSLLAGTGTALVLGVAINLASVMRLRLLPQRRAWGRPSWKVFKEVFAFANDLFLMTIGLQLLNASQVIIITRTLGLEMAAVWSVASKAFLQLAFQFVQRILDFSYGALGEMIVRNERS